MASRCQDLSRCSLFTREMSWQRGWTLHILNFLDDLTPCQKHQERAKELSASGPNPWNFIPRCREDGGYYEVQCHVGTGQCWCVDENGNERWGTTVRGLPDCSGMQNKWHIQRQSARNRLKIPLVFENLLSVTSFSPRPMNVWEGEDLFWLFFNILIQTHS